MDIRGLFEDGPDIVDIDDPESRSSIGAHWHAVQDFLASDPSDPDYDEVIERLHEFEGYNVDGRFFITDEYDIEGLANEGEIDEGPYEGV